MFCNIDNPLKAGMTARFSLEINVDDNQIDMTDPMMDFQLSTNT